MHKEDFLDNYNDYLSLLDKREQTIIKKHFGLDNEEKISLEKIGKELGLSRERVRQIEAKALKKIRDFITGNQK